jgi:hypothetical protein
MMVTVYIDQAFIPAVVPNGARTVRSRWCHMTADTVEELHLFAEQIGMRRSWFQPDHRPGVLTIRGSWHYDVTAGRRTAAIRAGAVEVDHAGLMAVMRRPGRETQKPVPEEAAL